MNDASVPFDPDFDQAPQQVCDTTPTSLSTADPFFEALGSRRAFFAGLLLSLLTLMSLGFLVLLRLLLKDGSISL